MTDDQILKKKRRKTRGKHRGYISNSSNSTLDNSMNQNGIAIELIESRFNRSQSFISRTLKKINYSSKRLSLVPAEINTSRLFDSRQTYCNNLMNILFERLVFSNEIDFNLHISVNFGYSPVNTKAYIVVRANRGTKQSLMCVVDINDIIVSDNITGAYEGDKFEIFIEFELLSYFLIHRGFILIMNNCRFHHRADVLRLLNQNEIEYIFLPAYSPQLNSIEEFFNSIKARYKNIRVHPSTLEQSKFVIRGIIENYDVSLSFFFERMSRFLRLGFSRQPFN
ncbi:hypothetical protein CDIK_2149 [Cucumispora dikerogammari]|nr:hypothetical protein CDIK_2149 [Cucumispora dikerogammari]